MALIRHGLFTHLGLRVQWPAESALNEEAGKLLLENYADYEKHARLMTSIHAQPSKRYGSCRLHAAQQVDLILSMLHACRH